MRMVHWLAVLSVGWVCMQPSVVAAGVTVGAQAPDFTLTDTEGEDRSLSDSAGRYVILEWTNPDCPFVRKFYDSATMQGLQERYTGEDVVWLSICSSAQGKQGHYVAEEWNKIIEEKGIASTAVLLDADGAVGRLYGAKTTPHMYVIDPEGVLIYQGAIDSIPSTDPADIERSANYVIGALEAHRSAEVVDAPSTKPYGCSVKY